MNWRIFIFTLALALLAGLSLASAEEPAGGIATTDEDAGFGEHALPAETHFTPTRGLGGRVDRRDELNPLADRSIGWSTGYIAPAGTVQYTNTLLLGQRLAVSATDRVQIFAQAFLPLGRQTYLSAGSQFHVLTGDAWTLTGGALVRHRRTNYVPGTTDTGLGLHAVFDVIAGDNTTWNAGVAANIAVRQSVEVIDMSRCENRRMMAEGHCIATEPQVQMMPASGYWVSVYGGFNHFVTDWLLFNFEVFTGASQGNFWGLERTLGMSLDYPSEQAMVEERNWSAGLGPLGRLTLGLGTTWIVRGVGFNLSMYAASYGGESLFIPYFSMGSYFGRRS